MCLDGLLYETYSCDTEFLLIGVHSIQPGAFCDIPPVLFLVPHKFNLLRVIHHQGNDRKSGHYYVSDVVNGLMLSDSIVKPSMFSSRHAYIALYQNSDAACSTVAFRGVSNPNENADTITSNTNTKTPLGQVRATPPTPEFEHMPGESPMETSATCTVTNEETTLATRRAEATAAVDLGKGNARRLAKGPRCTPHTGFNLLAAAEKQERKKELAREQKKKSRLKSSVIQGRHFL